MSHLTILATVLLLWVAGLTLLAVHGFTAHFYSDSLRSGFVLWNCGPGLEWHASHLFFFNAGEC